MRFLYLWIVLLGFVTGDRAARHSRIAAELKLTQNLLDQMKEKVGSVDKARMSMISADGRSIEQLKNAQKIDKVAMLALGQEEKRKMDALAKDLDETVMTPILDSK